MYGALPSGLCGGSTSPAACPLHPMHSHPLHLSPFSMWSTQLAAYGMTHHRRSLPTLRAPGPTRLPALASSTTATLLSPVCAHPLDRWPSPLPPSAVVHPQPTGLPLSHPLVWCILDVAAENCRMTIAAAGQDAGQENGCCAAPCAAPSAHFCALCGWLCASVLLLDVFLLCFLALLHQRGLLPWPYLGLPSAVQDKMQAASLSLSLSAFDVGALRRPCLH